MNTVTSNTIPSRQTTRVARPIAVRFPLVPLVVMFGLMLAAASTISVSIAV